MPKTVEEQLKDAIASDAIKKGVLDELFKVFKKAIEQMNSDTRNTGLKNYC